MELRIYFLQKLTFIENQTFLRKFSTTKIWSYTVLATPVRKLSKWWEIQLAIHPLVGG